MTRKLALACAAAGLAAAATLVGTGQARTQGGQPWVVNGAVDSLAVSGHTLYLGGDFSRVSLRTGSIVAFSPTGARLGFPVAEGGSVRAVVGDGNGGWFVGGDFTRMGGIACPGLAHVTANRAVDRRFCPKPDDTVLALVVDGPTLYAGGEFRHIGSTQRSNLAALDAATGRVAAWNPKPDDYVTGLTSRNGVLYLAGGFGFVGGKERSTLGAVDERTGKATGWDPKVPEDDHGDPTVAAIAAGTSAIYVGGSFDQIDGRKRLAVAAVDPATGKLTSWAPAGHSDVLDLTVAASRLYVGDTRLTAYDLASGKRVPWNAKVGPGGVTAVGVAGSRVYVSDNRLEAFDAATARRVSWQPATPNGPAESIAATPGVVVVGGRFSGTGGVARDGLAALDLRTGNATAWDPAVGVGGAFEVNAIAPAGRVVYVGGAFERLGGARRHLVGAFDAATGKVTSWAPPVEGDQILAIAAAGPKIYVGGYGTSSQFDTSGGLGWASPPQTGDLASVSSILVTHGLVYVGGWFEVVGGKSRLGLAALDPSNGAATAWNAQLVDKQEAEPQVQALAVSGSTLLAGGSFTSAGGAKRLDLASFDLGTGKVTPWAPKVDILTVYALAVTSRLVYVGGDGGIVAVNAKTGAQLDWHPALTEGSIGFTLVHSIAVVGSTVYVGGDGGLDVFPVPRG